MKPTPLRDTLARFKAVTKLSDADLAKVVCIPLPTVRAAWKGLCLPEPATATDKEIMTAYLDSVIAAAQKLREDLK